MELRMKHEKAPDYSVNYSSGLMSIGPFADGTMHLTFFHDTANVAEEVFNAEEVTGGLKLTRHEEKMPSEPMRREVATIIVNAASLDQIIQSLESARDGMKKQGE